MRITPDWIFIILGVFSVVLIPVLTLLYRGVVKWTRTESQLATLVKDVRTLIEEKDKVHAELTASMNKVHGEILEQMRVDRENADRRLRFIEEFWMRGGPVFGREHGG